MKNNIGILAAIGAYTCWGIFPLFWKHLDHVNAIEITLHRMVWSSLFIVGLIVVIRQWREFVDYLRRPALLGRLFIAALLLSVNWWVFVWAVNNDKVVEASLGYFINPLLSVMLAVVFFSERLRWIQAIAVLIAAAGVATLVAVHGQLPVVSLMLAGTFSLYSVIKKTIAVPATHGMAIETLFMCGPATVYLVMLSGQDQGYFGRDLATDGLLIVSGLLTLIPLTFFALAAKKISLTALGMSQYIAPFIQLLIGVFIYQEPFGSDRLIAFSLVWLALLIFSLDQLRQQRKHRRLLAVSPS